MALTITDIGNGISGVASTTVVTGATITASIGDWLVAIIAADNAAASGAASLTTVQDSAGNTWTQRAKINRTDANASNDGATFGIFTAAVTIALSGGTVTANFSTNTTRKTIEVYRAQPGAGETISFVAADATGTTGNSTTPASNTVSVTNGDTIFAGCACELRETGVNVITGDSDTTNGNWSALITRATDSGNNTTSMDGGSQYKTVNATGNQTWDGTLGASVSWASSYLVIGPLVTATPFVVGDFQNPRKQTSVAGHINQAALNLLGQDQFFGASGQGPRYDYPNPRIAPRSIELRSWVNTQIPPPPIAPPIFPALWDNPVKAKAVSQTWAINLLETTLAVTAVPFTALEWRVPGPPRRGDNTWTVNLLLSTLAIVPVPPETPASHIRANVSGIAARSRVSGGSISGHGAATGAKARTKASGIQSKVTASSTKSKGSAE